MTEPYREAIDIINGKFMEKIEEIKSIEEPLKKRKEEIEDIQERIKKEKLMAEEQRVNNRINELIKNGCVFDGEFYSISSPEYNVSESSIGVVDIRNMSDELYKQFLQVVIDKNTVITMGEDLKKERQWKEEERKKKEDEEKQAALDKMKREQEEKDAEIEKLKDMLKKQQEAADKAERERLDGIYQTRSRFLLQQGMSEGYDMFTYGDKSIKKNDIRNMEDSQFNSLVAPITEFIAKDMAQKAEEKRREEEARIEDAKKKAIEEENKRKEEEALKEQEKLAASSDKVKYEALVSSLKEIKFPDFKSTKYNAKVNAIKKFIDSLTSND